MHWGIILMQDIQSSIDLTLLTDVVRQAQRSQSFELLDWNVHILSERGTGDPEGLLRVSGIGRDEDGVRPWAVALKVIKRSLAGNIAPSHLGYWRRETNAYTSGLLANLPGPVMPACCYAITEQPDSAWIWMELLTDVTGGAWDLSHYAFAADQLGRFNGACARTDPLPNAPWLARDHARVWNGMMSFDAAWQDPRVRQHLTPQMGERLLRLWNERERFFTALERLPQGFSHFDFKRANLFLRNRDDGQLEVAAIDWGDCGIGALGGDLALLVGGSCFFFDWDPLRVAELSEVAYTAYLTGLHASGWQGNDDQVRLAYTAWMALYWGPPVTAAVAFFINDENRPSVLRIFGRPPEELPVPMASLCAFAMECADEARILMVHVLT